MLADAKLVAFVATSDLGRSRGFYGELLGFPVLETNELATSYDVDGTELRVTLVERVRTAPYTVLGLHVPDIVAAIRKLRDAGVVFKRYAGLTQDDDAVWNAPGGTRVAWFADPDGNLVSLQQPPSN